jgi:hypothetical protein
MKIPTPDYLTPASFGSLELKNETIPSSSGSRSITRKTRWSRCRPSASIRSTSIAST